MQFKKKLVYIVLSCVLMLSGAVILINIQAQAPEQAQIVFQSDRDGIPAIYVMDADGQNQRSLFAGGGLPSWSPDGESIVFVSGPDETNLEIYVMDADGQNPRRLTDNPAEDSAPSWSPDGRSIVFHSNRDGNREIYVMDANGENQRRLTNHPELVD